MSDENSKQKILKIADISDRIIAMGFPSETVLQGFIRNSIETVSKFLKEKHPDSFKVINLCIEAKYEQKLFNNQVEWVPMHDHNAPRFSQILTFCSIVHDWLTMNGRNVIAVHCKAGKGRTGTMISCYYIYSRRCSDPFSAMNEFSEKRTTDSRGVTIPAQRRFIEYYADFITQKRDYEQLNSQEKCSTFSSSSIYFLPMTRS